MDKQQVLGPNAINTHFFDGKLQTLEPYIHDDLIMASQVSKDEKMLVFNQLTQKLSTINFINKAHSLHTLKIIIDTFQVNGYETHVGNSNYDRANDLHADDLLYLLGLIILEDNEKANEHALLLLLQLQDLLTGMCPQGRTTRLFQCLVLLKEKLD